MLLPALVSVPLGIARHAVDEIARQVREGRTARRGQLADDPNALGDLAMADARLCAARATVREAVATAERWAGAAGSPVPRPVQARTIVAYLHACDTSVEVTGVAHRLGGGAAAYTGSPLLRALADVEAARQHLMFSHHHLVALAPILAGVDAPAPPLVL